MEKLKLLKTLSTIILIAVASSIFWFGNISFAATPGSVAINEIMYDLKEVADDKHEWVEIYNTTEGAIDITGWKFNDGENHILNVPPANGGQGELILPIGGFAVLADNATQFLADHPGFAGTVIDTVMSLNNSSDALSLLINDKINDKIVVDTAVYQNGWGANGNGKTLERVNGIWQESAQEGGTPGRANNSAATNSNTNANSTTSTNSNSSVSTNTNSGSVNTNASYWPVLSSLIFNEVYPNPPDESTEFIELKNASGFAGSPAGWKIKDAAGDEYAMPDKEIADGALWIIPKLESGISLNNDGETLTLVNPNGAAFATLAIPSAPESQSYARSGAESFEWTITLTAGAENIFTQTVSAPAEIVAPVNTNSPATNVDTSNSNSSVNANASTSANINSPKTAADFSAIKLSEIMPNPEGDDADGEWIELYNSGDKEIDLAGGSLSDASGKIYAIPKNTIISAKSYKVFYRNQTGIVLNNDQDTIDLKDSSGKKIDSISYADGAEGKSYGLAGKNWQWSDPTPAKANFQAAGAGANANENTNSSGIKRVGATINEAKNAKSDAIITVSGIVTAAFGEIAKNTFYIQDDTGGMAVVIEITALKISRGDFVVVKGKMKTSGGEKILSADDEKKITVQSSGNNAAAWQMNIADIDSQSLGLFIGVSGKAVELTPKGFIIDDGSGSLAILPPGETSVEKGQIASIQGILKKTKDGIVLILRDKNDFISGNVLGESDQKNLSIAGNGKKYDIIIQLLIIIVTLLVGGYAARKYLQKYSYATSDTKPAEESKEDRDSNSGFGI